MLAIQRTSKFVQRRRSALAFQRSNHVTQYRCRTPAQNKVHMVLFPIKCRDFALVVNRNLRDNGVQEISLLRREYPMPKFRNKDHVSSQVVNTMACTVKVKIPDTLAHRLTSLLPVADLCIKRMLNERHNASTSDYPELPSILSKALVRKYQNNAKCKSVSNIVIPICGDKERQIRFVNGGVQVQALFQKEVLPVSFPHPVVADEQGRRNVSVEFFQRAGQWFATFTYRTPQAKQFKPTGMIGIDRNSVGHVATLADPTNGKVLHLGFNPAATKTVWRGRKRNLQSKGKNRLLCKIKRKQSRRTTHENHLVSKAIVDYAVLHRRAIVLEDLGHIRNKGSKIKGYTERSQWAFFQLLQFIIYKAALRGVMVFQVHCAYTSQECSRCGALNKPAGKKYVCARCRHKDHRDANAGFCIAGRISPIGGFSEVLSGTSLRPLGDPLSGTDWCGLGLVELMPCQ